MKWAKQIFCLHDWVAVKHPYSHARSRICWLCEKEKTVKPKRRSGALFKKRCVHRWRLIFVPNATRATVPELTKFKRKCHKCGRVETGAISWTLKVLGDVL